MGMGPWYPDRPQGGLLWGQGLSNKFQKLLQTQLRGLGPGGLRGPLESHVSGSLLVRQGAWVGIVHSGE
jgi:hypothetical protein